MFPETDPRTYKLWMDEEWHDYTLRKLRELLLYVRDHPIVGLGVEAIRGHVFVPFGGPNLFNRKASLLLAEIEANQAHWQMPIDEEKFDTEYKLSGLTRP
ncbi:hypothetical protein LCGC14_1020870 [marine sediment metagenome]|uniref:Uncharacterized protein n=1 Tax=marine sediment metagenome TaxID=412755 RepID=A0A0F9N1Z1_9ZZZZ